MKHIILGDVHLGKGVGIGKPPQGGGLNSRIQDQINLLDWALDKAVEIEAENIFITGDVYDDPRPHPAIINLFMAWLKRCEKKNIFVHIIAGNHDILRTGQYTLSALDLVTFTELPKAIVYKTPTAITIDNKIFSLMPYRDRRMYEVNTTDEALQLLKNEILPGNVLIGHLTIEGSIFVGDEIDDMLNEIFCPVSMFDSFEYVFMGHVHEPQLFKFTNIYNVGSMDRTDFSDSEMNTNKFLCILNSSSMKVHREQLPTRTIQLLSFYVPSGKDSTDFIKHELFMANKERSLKDNIIRIEIQLESDVDNVNREAIMSYLYTTLGVHHCHNFSESRKLCALSISDDQKIDTTMNPISAIHRFYDNLELEAEEKEEARAIALYVNSQYEETKAK